MASTVDTSKTLDELHGIPFGPPSFPSSLVTTVCALYKDKPLREFTPGDLRIIIGQKFSLPFLIPLALNVLIENPWVDATYYEGDLLHNVLCVPDEFWNAHAEDAAQLLAVLDVADCMEAKE